MMLHRKIVFAGSMGAGKTTAIHSLSDITPIATEVSNLDKSQHSKATTTVALDYGEVDLGDGEKLSLYGTPGQERFSFMWPLIARGALGVIILIDHSRPAPLEDLQRYLGYFRPLLTHTHFVIGVGRVPTDSIDGLSTYIQYLREMKLLYPVLAVDVRERSDVLLLVDVLLSLVETP